MTRDYEYYSEVSSKISQLKIAQNTLKQFDVHMAVLSAGRTVKVTINSDTNAPFTTMVDIPTMEAIRAGLVQKEVSIKTEIDTLMTNIINGTTTDTDTDESVDADTSTDESTSAENDTTGEGGEANVTITE